MEENEEIVSKPKRKRTAVRIEQDGPGRYSIVSKNRIKNGTDVAVGETWQHESDREQGDNDPNSRR